jgi:hypothetical protein
VVKPPALDQSKRDSTKEPRSWSVDFITSSKVLEFLSRHTVHIKQWGTKFHMLDWCLPNQFLHPNKKMLCFYKNDSAKPIVSHLSHSHLNSFDKHKKYSQQLLD